MKEKYSTLIGKTITQKEIDAEQKIYEEMSCKPSTKRLNENHVIDEEKSVRWNREQVKKHNDALEKEVKELNRKKNAQREKVVLMYQYLIHEELEWKFTDKDVFRLYEQWRARFKCEHHVLSFYKFIIMECEQIREMDFYKHMKTKKGWK